MSRHFAGYSSVDLETIWLHEPRDLIFQGPLMTLLCLSRYSSTYHSEQRLGGEQKISRGSCVLLNTDTVVRRLISQLDKSSSSVRTGLINLSTHNFGVLLSSALLCKMAITSDISSASSTMLRRSYSTTIRSARKFRGKRFPVSI